MNKVFKFHRIDEEHNVDVWEDVNIDDHLWQWEAEMLDGSIISQFDENVPLPEFGENVFLFRQTKDIDQSKLKEFRAIAPRLNQTHILRWNPKRWKLVALYRTANLAVKIWYDKKHFDETGEKVEKQVERKVFHVFIYGYENNVGGIVVKNFNAIMPNHEIITTDDLESIQLDATPTEEWLEE